jgi:hypothetical protein
MTLLEAIVAMLTVRGHDIADTFTDNTSLTDGSYGDALERAPGHEFED